MEHQLLSLKNIYRLLMARDFPLYSESVIGEKERKGVTVLRFWQQILIEEFKNLPCGRNDLAVLRRAQPLHLPAVQPQPDARPLRDLCGRAGLAPFEGHRPQPGGPLLAVSLRQAVQARRSSAAGGSVSPPVPGRRPLRDAGDRRTRWRAAWRRPWRRRAGTGRGCSAPACCSRCSRCSRRRATPWKRSSR